MFGYVTVEVQGPDMDGAARYAQRLANDFIEDLDTMQRASRARDRRAMSHLEMGSHTDTWYPERRRSLSYVSTRSASPTYTHYYRRPHYPQTLYPTRLVTYQAPPVMMVGKSTNYPPSYTNGYRPTYNSYPYTPLTTWDYPTTPIYSYPYTYTPSTAWDLPTSSLRAHPPVRRPIMTPGALDYLNYRRALRRSLSDLYDYDYEEPVSRVVHRTFARRPPIPTVRLGSVPPVTTYRPYYYGSDISTPTVPTPRPYYRTTRYISDTPYYLNPYIHRTAEPTRPILTTHYSTAPAPITPRYTYYYPSVITGKQYVPRTVSYTNLSPEVQYERKRIERRMDDLLDYKLPPPEYYREMRGSLRGLHDKLDEHRRLLDRYSGVEMDTAPLSVGDRIESKYQQLANRMGRRSTATARV